jgi:penicillin amidase
VISDAPALSKLDLPATALKWRGHEPSDESTAFLRAAAATNWEEFRAAFETYAVSGQNFVYADAEGNIGQVLGMEFDPAAGRTPLMRADPQNPEHLWTHGIPSTELPAALNPDSGYIVSANNTPLLTDPPLTVAGNANDRVDRASDLLEDMQSATVDDLIRVQRDVFSISGLEAARTIVERAGEADESALLRALREWDGQYLAESEGAAAFQITLHHLLEEAMEPRYGKKIAGFIRSSKIAPDFAREDIEAGEITEEQIVRALEFAARDFGDGKTWGDLHTIKLSHPIGLAPIIGEPYRFGEVPAPGTSGTLYKTAHGVTNKKHASSFGANARFVTDMGSPDENYFVLWGGQDGWLGSENFLDQVEMWRSGKYIRIPITEDAVRDGFRQVVLLRAP